MKTDMSLNNESIVLDIGSGRGLPSLHYAQLPVALSFGIEMEETRYFLGMNNLCQVLKKAKTNGVLIKL